MKIDKKKFEESAKYINAVNKSRNPDFSEFFEDWWEKYYNDEFAFTGLSNRDFIDSDFAEHHKWLKRKV